MPGGRSHNIPVRKLKEWRKISTTRDLITTSEDPASRKMANEGGSFDLSLGVKMMKKTVNWIGRWKNHVTENVLHCGGNWKDQPPGEDLVLDHIILDLTGDSVPLDHIADASVQRAFKRTKRLLRRSNTVLFSRLGIMVGTKHSSSSDPFRELKPD